MAQVLVLGDSIAHGVGGENGGWSDMLKRELHKDMYSGENYQKKHELYIFANPGEQTQFVLNTYKEQLKFYKKDGHKTVAMLLVGTNDVKAINDPENFLTTSQEYKQEMYSLLSDLKENTDDVYVFPLVPTNEEKTFGKLNAKGSISYFSNKRIKEFNKTIQELTEELKLNLIEYDFEEQYWLKNCLSADGLHPNDTGYKLMFEAVKKKLVL